VVDVTEILIHWHAGRSQSEVATSLGVDRKTVKKYLAPAIAAGIVPGDQARSGEAWAELVRAWWPGAGRRAAAADDVAADRGASRGHQVAAGCGHGSHDLAAAA
jgi:hypothetical protein